MALQKLELAVGLGCDLLWKMGRSSGCPCQMLAFGGLRSTWSTSEMFMGKLVADLWLCFPHIKGWTWI